MARQALKDSKWKSRIDLLQPEFLLEMWQIMRAWAEKYVENTWQGVPLKHHYWATMRHLLAFRAWEDIDPESWYSHLAHAANNIMFMFYNKEKQDWMFPELKD